MKTYLALILAAIALLFSGCATATRSNQSRAAQFIAFLASHDIKAANATQETDFIVYGHTERVDALSKDKDITTIAGLQTSLWIQPPIPLIRPLMWKLSFASLEVSKRADLAALASGFNEPAKLPPVDVSAPVAK